MSLLSILHSLENEIAEYAELTGKDIETIREEFMVFIKALKTQAVNASVAGENAAASTSGQL